MSRLAIILILLFVIMFVRAQDATRNLSREEAVHLFRSLNGKIPDSTRIKLYLRLAQFNILKPGEFKADIDSAEGFILEAERINPRLRSAESDGAIDFVKFMINREKGQKKAAKALLEKAIKTLQGTNEHYYLGQAYFELSQLYEYDEADQLVRMIQLVQQAVSEFELSGHTEIKAFSLKMLADLYDLNNEDGKALEALNRSLAAYKSIHYAQLQGVYDLFGVLYSGLIDLKHGVQYGLMALQTAEAVHDSTMQLCEIYNHLSNYYCALFDQEKGLYYLKKAMNIAVINKDIKAIYLVGTNIARVYIALDKPADALQSLKEMARVYAEPGNVDTKFNLYITYLDIYIKIKDHQNAATYCQKLIHLINGPSLSDPIKNQGYLRIVNFYISFGEYASALAALKKSEALSLTLDDKNVLATVYSYWFRMDTAQKRYRSAINKLLKSKKISDSLLTETKSRQITQLEIQYETKKKEDSLKLKDQDILLLTQKNQLQQGSLRQSNLIRDTTFAGIILLSVIIGLLYNKFRHKQKSNKVITHKNTALEHLVTEKEWLLKEVHHRVKNNLQIMISLLNTQSKYLTNEEAVAAVTESRHRMQAMSLIHQKLYRSDNVAYVNMTTYIGELVDYLDAGFGADQQICFHLDIEPIDLDLSQAIPVGLILNETITNSIKHAFTDRRQGTITISMKDLGENKIALEIRDDGQGMPITNEVSEDSSMGMRLIRGLIDQIEGNFILDNDNGFCLHIVFQQDLVLRAVAS